MVGFNRGALWQVPRMYDVGGKLLNRIKSMYFNSLVCEEDERECFRVDSGVRQDASCSLSSSMWIWMQ